MAAPGPKPRQRLRRTRPPCEPANGCRGCRPPPGFCRQLTARGARTIGLDPTAALIDAARARGEAGSYVRGDAEALPLPDACVDVVVLYLTLIDIPDHRSAIAEAARVLRPGGRLVAATLQSFATTRPGSPWVRDEAGAKLHVAVGDYSTERPQRLAWSGLGIVNHHRPLESYVGELLRRRLTLTDFEEPRPSHEAVQTWPALEDEQRIPIFWVMAWRR